MRSRCVQVSDQLVCSVSGGLIFQFEEPTPYSNQLKLEMISYVRVFLFVYTDRQAWLLRGTSLFI